MSKLYLFQFIYKKTFSYKTNLNTHTQTAFKMHLNLNMKAIFN